MTYFILDTNVWLDFIIEINKDIHPIDLLKFWIEKNEVIILLPEVIIEEWNKHKSSQIEQLYDVTNEKYVEIEKMLGESHQHIEKLKNIKIDAGQKVQEVDDIFSQHSIVIQVTDVDRVNASHMAVNREKPFGSKNSMCDALIYLGMVRYIKDNQLKNCVFATTNYSDFSQSKEQRNIIHDHLKPTFNDLRITYEYIKNIDSFMKKYSAKFTISKELSRVNADEVRSNYLSYKTIETKKISAINTFVDSFIDNTDILNTILKSNHPTKQQAIFALELFNSNHHYQQYIIRNIEKAQWFNSLNEAGILNPKRANITNSKEVTQNSFWTPLLYLEKISEQIKEGNNFDLIDEIIEIVKDITEYGIKQYGTLYSIIKIIANLPNDKISIEILNLIPIWLDSNLETYLESSGLCEELLPKFLTDDPHRDDIEKAEIILKHLFAIDLSERVYPLPYGGNARMYHSKVSLYHFREALIENKLIQKIAKYCSDDLILYIANTIKKLALYFPEDVFATTFQDDTEEYTLKVAITGTDLVVTVTESHSIDAQQVHYLTGYENYNQEQTELELLRILNGLNINSETDENKAIVTKIARSLFNGSDYLYYYAPVSDLSLADSSENVNNVFALIFREVLSERTKLRPIESLDLLRKFMSSNLYRIHFFRKVVLFVIGENWEVTKSIFFDSIDIKDSCEIFANVIFQQEVYEILNKNQSTFTSVEINLFNDCIDYALLNNENDKYESTDIQKLRWYSALNLIEPFKSKYEELADQLNLSKDEFNSNIPRSGFIELTSPFSYEELLTMKNKDIVDNIVSFKSTSYLDTPSIEGFSQTLEKVVSANPQKFSIELVLFENVYYIYAYHILNGFRKAIASKTSFNELNVIEFCKNYVSSESFNSNQLSLQSDHWKASKEWVIGSVSNFLSEWLQTDDKTFDIDLLSSAKELILILINKLSKIEQVHQKRATINYSVNSVCGKVLQSMLDYSIVYSRTIKPEAQDSKWDEDAKDMFLQFLNNEIIETYFIIGYFFVQFYLIDKEWIITKIDEFILLDDDKWYTFFFGGYVYGNRPVNKEIYELFYPHFERAVKNAPALEIDQAHALNKHLLAFYFWEFEDLRDEGLFKTYLNNINPLLVVDLIQWVCSNGQNLYKMEIDTRNNHFKRILELWMYIYAKYENSIEPAELNIKANLYKFITFVPQLDEQYTKLLLASCNPSDSQYFTKHQFSDLIRLKSVGDPFESALYLSKILDAILLKPTTISHYITSNNQLHIKDLVAFLCENGQRERGLNLCEELAKNGHYFLIEVYHKYT